MGKKNKNKKYDKSMDYERYNDPDFKEKRVNVKEIVRKADLEKQEDNQKEKDYVDEITKEFGL